MHIALRTPHLVITGHRFATLEELNGTKAKSKDGTKLRSHRTRLSTYLCPANQSRAVRLPFVHTASCAYHISARSCLRTTTKHRKIRRTYNTWSTLIMNLSFEDHL